MKLRKGGRGTCPTEGLISQGHMKNGRWHTEIEVRFVVLSKDYGKRVLFTAEAARKHFSLDISLDRIQRILIVQSS
jgi:hypothetical protein